MLETLRLNGSVVFIPKTTGDSSYSLAIAGKEHIIPRNTWVVTNSQALHTNADVWGADALVWRPSRWIKSVDGREELMEPPEGSFVPWADVPRVCPGNKFSQVEFAGVMAVLFEKHRVRVRKEDGENEEDSLVRVDRMVEDSAISTITLQMRHPESVALVWTERQPGEDEGEERVRGSGSAGRFRQAPEYGFQ